MRSFVVFIATFLISHVVLIYVYTGFLAQAPVSVIAVCALLLGVIFGCVASFWSWALTHAKAFLSASFLSALVILLPFLLNTYGFAIVALPLVFLWTWANFLGMKYTERWRKVDLS
jgi:hypothetical protein